MLPKRHRVVDGSDYRRVVRSGQRLRTPGAVIHVKITAPDCPARFGFIVSKVVGKAHLRNLIRRRYKSIARELVQQGISGADVVIRADAASTAMTFSELRSSTVSALQRHLVSGKASV